MQIHTTNNVIHKILKTYTAFLGTWVGVPVS